MGTCMQFGYTRKDIILLGVGIIAFGYALYYGLQAFFGVDALVAGNYVQLFVFLGIGVGYISTYHLQGGQQGGISWCAAYGIHWLFLFAWGVDILSAI